MEEEDTFSTYATPGAFGRSLDHFSFKLAHVMGSPIRFRSLKMFYCLHTVSNSYLSTQVVGCKVPHCALVFFRDVLIKSQFLTYNFAIYFTVRCFTRLQIVYPFFTRITLLAFSGSV
jgi:hypothetical protein